MNTVKYFIIVVLIVQILFSCKTKNEKELPFKRELSADDTVKTMLPITYYLEAAMGKIINTNYPNVYENDRVLKIVKTIDLFKLELAPFFINKINDTNLLPYFKQTSFADTIKNLVTYVYERKKVKIPDSIDIKDIQIDISNLSKDIERIFITRSFKKSDTTYLQQLSWYTKSRVLIREYYEYNSSKKILSIDKKIEWNSKY